MGSNIIYYAIPLFSVSILIESLYSRHNNLGYYNAKDTISSLSMGIGNVVIRFLVSTIALTYFYFLYQFSIYEFGNNWQTWVVLIIAEDFTYYWFHRFSHKSRFLWASHVIHHSSKQYNLSTALRQTWTGHLTGKFIFWSWLVLVGFHPLMIITMKSINLIYQFWIHTEAINKMPKIFEFIFNTPSHHRVHHGTNIIYIDKNYAGIFIIWDKLFKTFQPEIHTPTYGIMHNIRSYNPFYIATHEWFSILRDMKLSYTIKENLAYIFKPPGWSHDNSRKTIETIRKEQNAT